MSNCSIFTLAALATATLVSGCGSSNAVDGTAAEKPIQSAKTRGRPNVIYIYADDLGYGDLSCYGATRVQTPHVDTLAHQGLRFTDAHATSATCTPSRYGLLTGEYPWRKPNTGILPGDAASIIKPGRETLATVFQKGGYATGIVGKWHLGLGDGQGPIDWNKPLRVTPLDVGFDYSFIMAATADRVPCVYIEGRNVVGLDSQDPIKVSYRNKVGNRPTGKENPGLLTKQGLTRGHDNTIINSVSRIGFMDGGESALWKDEDMAQTYVKKALEFIDSNKQADKPFFLYFATNDIHVPRMPNAGFTGKSELGLRGDVILQFDWCVGALMKALKERGLEENTLVILSSDNGPVLDDGYADGAVEKNGDHQPAGPFRGGKYTAYEGGTRVPFIVNWPGRVAPGVSDALICQMDLLASFAAFTGVAYDKSTAPDSQDLLPVLLGLSEKGRETLVEQGTRHLALRAGQWKLVAPYNAVRPNPARVELYDLSKDIAEKNNVIGEHPEAAARLFALLDAERAKGDATRNPK